MKRLIRKHRATTGLNYSMKTKLNLNRVVEGAKFQIRFKCHLDQIRVEG